MSGASVKPCRILLVDDSDHDRAEAKAALLNGSLRRWEIFEAAYGEDALRLCALTPTVLCALHRLRYGLEPLDPRPELGHAANYLWMLTGEEMFRENQDMLVNGIRSYNNLLESNKLTMLTSKPQASQYVSKFERLFKAIAHGVVASPELQYNTLMDIIVNDFEVGEKPESSMNSTLST